ncbi:MAG: beta-3-deoxy-D-manno-oct-2-ulosonic acid transferase [Brachymonas sp.]|nr:beta-3-deoxy-D-manno-oct-2-ulosonic acid transferase [Brachymonas sp.]
MQHHTVLQAHDLGHVPPGATALVWGRNELNAPVAQDVQVLHLEDGFLRSVGLGADLVEPISWVCDSQGIYFDATQRSDLESMLQNAEFTEPMLSRAALLQKSIVSTGLSKYNVGDKLWIRPRTPKKIVLVVGQVESDASIQFGAHYIKTNLALIQAVRTLEPDAFIVYKPHPDVLAGLRSGKLMAEHGLYDALVEQASMPQLLTQIDAVHVNTSLTGFEALLRGVPVITHGMPFYAGWGLTLDMAQNHAALKRRTKRLRPEELIAAALICYPLYRHPDTHQIITPEEAVKLLAKQMQAAIDLQPSVLWRLVLSWAARFQGRF